METALARLLGALRDAVLRGPPLRLAVLFGSHARGGARADSDVDVGIIPVDPDLALSEELELQSRLCAAIHGEVDLVRLDGDDLLLGREASRDGILVYEERPGTLARYRARATADWIEFETSAAPARAHYLSRLAQRAPGSPR